MTQKQKALTKKLNSKWTHVNVANEIELVAFVLIVLGGLLSTMWLGSVCSWICILFFLLFAFQAKVPFKYSNEQNKKLAYFMDKANNNDLAKYPNSFKSLHLDANSLQTYYKIHWYNWI